MRKNIRRSKKMSVVAQYTANAAAIMLAVFVVVIINLLANSSCSQKMKTIGEKERILARLEDERIRESARWEEMTATHNFEKVLPKRGISMHAPEPTKQIVNMTKDGRMMPGQVAVARVQQRNSATGSVAMNSAGQSNRGSRSRRR